MEVEITVFVGIVTAAFLFFYFRRRSKIRAWSKLAAQTGLACEGGNLFSPVRVTGTYRGRNLILETFTTGGKNSEICTRTLVNVDSAAPLHLKLSEEGILAKIGKKLGGQDIQTGDAALDRRFIIKGEPEGEIQRLLTSSDVRQKLLSLPGLSVEIAGGEIRYEQYSFEKNVKRLHEVFDLLCLLAEGVEKNKSGAV